MYTQAILLSILVAVADARFAQEQAVASIIGAVTSGGGPGVAATIAGSSISTLLAAANPCAKLQKADEIIAQLGTGADAIAAARALVAAEQNFNPFNVKIPSICSDPTLPVSPEIRGVIPLIDPDVEGSAAANAASAASVITPLDATGKSVADVLAASGFTNFSTKDLAGTVGTPAAGAGGAAPAAPASSAAPAAPAVTAPAPAPAADVPAGCVGTVTVTAGAAATGDSEPAVKPATEATTGGETAAKPATGAAAGGASTLGLDFGTCIPTMDFQGGRNGRKATEFTFLPTDAAVAQGQQEALNPNIITNRICDQLTNVCAASAEAKTACLAAKATIQALGTRDAATAEAWNAALGFAGVVAAPAPAATEAATGGAATGGAATGGAATGGAATGGAATGGASGALDFGTCVPTMDFKGGRNGRKATEFTFLPTDAAVAQGQQEALNPNIITNRICDQLTNVCGASAEAKTACLAAKATIQALGTRDAATAEAWNAALGFPGAAAKRAVSFRA